MKSVLVAIAALFFAVSAEAQRQRPFEVIVINDAAREESIPVRESPREIYQQEITRSVQAGQSILVGFEPIPAGKRLVIEQISGRIVLSASDTRPLRYIAINTGVGAVSPFTHLLTVPDSHYHAFGTKEWVFSQSIRQYAEGSFPTGIGDFGVTVGASLPGTADFIQLDVSISGYLEDI